MRLSDRAQKISPSLTLVVSARAKQMIADGIEVLNFSAGEPDFDTPEEIKRIGRQALADGFTKYTAGGGIAELKQAVIAKYQKEFDFSYTPDQVLISNGGKHALHNILQALLSPGDEVLIPAPYWVSYPDMTKLSDGSPVIIPTTLENGFKFTRPDLEAAITPHTRLLILNSPSNPTGAVYTKAELEAIADLVKERDLLVISDDVYEKFVYDGHRFANLLTIARERNDHELLNQIIVINSASKTYAMTGWRMGLALGPAPVIAAATKIQGQATSCPGAMAQKAYAFALSCDQSLIDPFIASFEARRNMMFEGLLPINGIKMFKPTGAFYLFADVSGLYKRLEGVAGSVDFCTYLLEQLRIAAIPGAAFGDDRCIRFSFVSAETDIRKAITRLQNRFGTA